MKSLLTFANLGIIFRSARLVQQNDAALWINQPSLPLNSVQLAAQEVEGEARMVTPAPTTPVGALLERSGRLVSRDLQRRP